jgi:hypothetical protein
MPLFKRKKQIADDLVIDMEKVLEVFMASNDDILFEKIREITNEIVAEELTWFFPTILFHLTYPQVGNAYPKRYDVYLPEKNKFIRHKYADNETYILCNEFLTRKHSTICPEFKTRIVQSSAQFNAVNEMLNNGSKLEDLVLIPPTFIKR